MIRIPSIVIALAASASPSLAAAPACPGETFEAFLSAFSDSAAVQRMHVADPLSSGEIDPAAEPEPRVVMQRLPKAALGFPLMPLKAARQRDRLAMTRTNKGAGAVEVLLAQPDSGYQLRYLFRRAGDCWQLAEMVDESL